MRRREFITLLGSSLVVSSGATVAQQPEGNRRIGVISATKQVRNFVFDAQRFDPG